ncbi:MAG: GNAT family protein [Micropepsaceae bacterium]
MPQTYGPTLRFETPDFIVRSAVLGDETEAWGGWLEDPRRAAMLNAVPRRRTLEELRTYISGFDRIDRHLFGLFLKDTGRIIGIRTVEIDRARRAYTVHMLVGDSADWGRGAADQSTGVLVDWAYEVRDLLWIEGTVLAQNRKMIRYLVDSGWSITGDGKTPSAAFDGRLIDMVLLKRHRDVWRKDPRSSVLRGVPALTGLESSAGG